MKSITLFFNQIKCLNTGVGSEACTYIWPILMPFILGKHILKIVPFMCITAS